MIKEIEKHALAEWPAECVGYVHNGKYIKLDNNSNTPTKGYSLSLKDKILLNGLKDLTALVHSHPVMDNTPSKMDINAHLATRFNFWIIGCDGTNTTDIRKLNYETSTKA